MANASHEKMLKRKAVDLADDSDRVPPKRLFGTPIAVVDHSGASSDGLSLYSFSMPMM